MRRYLKERLRGYIEPQLGWWYRYANPTLQDIRDVLPHKEFTNLKTPDRLVFEVSNICNARCVFCAYRKLRVPSMIMPTDLFKDAINQALGIGIKKVMFSPTIGENLTDPEFFDKVRYAKKKGMFVEVCTNGVLLLENHNYKKMISSKVNRLGISMGDFDYRIEARVMGISRECANSKLEGILKLLEEKEFLYSDIDITLSLRPARSFKDIWEEIYNSPEWRYYYDKDFFRLCSLLSFDNWAGSITAQDLIGGMKLGKLRKNRRRLCSHFRDIIILPNGKVRICGCRVKDKEEDELVIGNLKGLPLKSIIENADLGRYVPPNGKTPAVCENCISYCT
jgi:MoaA/NifB/PqqE/SkfB family radical SAM enzyme